MPRRTAVGRAETSPEPGRDFDRPTHAGLDSEFGPSLGDVVITDVVYMVGWDVAKRVELAVQLPIDEYSRERVASGVGRHRPMGGQPVRTQPGYSVVRSSRVGVSGSDFLGSEQLGVATHHSRTRRIGSTAGRGAAHKGCDCNCIKMSDRH